VTRNKEDLECDTEQRGLGMLHGTKRTWNVTRNKEDLECDTEQRGLGM
jgi:hypothetical protein